VRVGKRRAGGAKAERVQGQARKKEAGGTRPHIAGFAGRLTETYTDQVISEMNRMLADVEEAAALLENEPGIASLREYKLRMRRLISRLIKHTYRVEEKLGFSRGGQRRILVLVKLVDERLDQLTQVVMSDNARALAVVSLMDEIRGILVDMYG